MFLRCVGKRPFLVLLSFCYCVVWAACALRFPSLPLTLQNTTKYLGSPEFAHLPTKVRTAFSLFSFSASCGRCTRVSCVWAAHGWPQVAQFVRSTAELCCPDDIYLCHGGKEEFDRLMDGLVASGELKHNLSSFESQPAAARYEHFLRMALVSTVECLCG